ncbi:gamma-glutamyl-gamma-aminobutyrate hydrolase family protein [Agrobacterium sp. BA1120]|uniref:gamma-glutamyl-gamma-aminobutyrate hydrolase family protein n=1 Tax=Agrobacterium sp. BA1120 TaxID=3228927 RepID=UPI00336A8AAB
MLMRTSSRPRIGITPDINDVAAPETEYEVRRNYADAIWRCGGLPLVLPYVDEAAAYLASIDGLLVTGGMFDIDPALYGQVPKQSYSMKPERTECEKSLIDGALEAGLPVLGVCNGMQLLAVCLGGQLVQDISREIPAALEHKPDQRADIVQHDITIARQSRCLPSLRPGRYSVNSVHHQAVQPSLRYHTVAIADDGVIEAIEATEHDFAVGVQWHPEYGAGPADGLIFKELINAARAYSLGRSGVLHV